MSLLRHHPVDFDEACEFIRRHHRHHLPPQGWKFGLGVSCGPRVVGVITVGRPVARMLDTGLVLEVTRCCVDPAWSACQREARKEGLNIGNAASLLYNQAKSVAFAWGFRRLITYTLMSESGNSLRCAGWRDLGPAGGGEWGRESRPRVTKAPTEQKTLWEACW